jgi:hypothetical protein
VYAIVTLQPKCGVYLDSADFFAEEELDPAYVGSKRFPTQPPGVNRFNEWGGRVRPLPQCGLADANEVLALQLEKLHLDRQAVRTLPFLELSTLFSDEALDDLRRCFSRADTDAREGGGGGGDATEESSGGVPIVHLPKLLDTIGLACDEPTLARLAVDLDKKSDSVLTFEEFVRAVYILKEQRLVLAESLLNDAGAHGDADDEEAEEDAADIAEALQRAIDDARAYEESRGVQADGNDDEGAELYDE